MRFAMPAIRFANRSLRVWLVAFSVIAASAARPLMSGASVAAQDLGIAIGEQAPGGPLETLDGKAVDLSQYLGKGPVVMEFWATWCPSCKQLEPVLRTAMTKYGKQVQFITIAVSANQSRERVAAWQKINKIPGALLYDRKGAVTGAYDVPATSYVVVIDKSGKIVYTGTGGTQDIEAALKKAL